MRSSGTSEHTHLDYRPDVDGLRALAILPVLAFHMGLPWLPGGFVGVDVFFVISGYLIAGTLLRDIETRGLSILAFYKRRALRIFPALAVLLLAVCAFAALMLRPSELGLIGQGVFASALFYSNILFWKNSGYFEEQSEQNPLLHTWSLSVEEQFYLFFPLILYAVHRWFGARYVLWFAAIAVLSFVLSIVGVRFAPSAAFYFLPSRSWELLLGALIAFGAAPRIARAGLREALALAGIVLLLGSMRLLSADAPFPGLNALYPCLGAALLIAYAPGTRVGRVLACRPAVGIGLISYSLYLWHWPVIVFWHRLASAEPDATGLVAIASLSFALAALSWYFVERPFRTPALRRLPSWRVVAAGASVLLAVAALGDLVKRQASGRRDFPPDIQAIADFGRSYSRSPEHSYQFRYGSCMVVSGEGTLGSFKPETCMKLDPARPNYVVLGDSHAAQIWRALALAFPEANFLQATSTGCRPIRGSWGKSPCTEIMDYVFDDFLPKNRVDGVIITARWKMENLPDLPDTIAYLRRHVGDVVVLGPAPKYNADVPTLLAEARFYGDPGIVASALDKERKRVSDAMAPVVEGAGATYVPIYDLVCPGGTCIELLPDGTPMQSDRDHLTLPAARLVAEGIRQSWMPRAAPLPPAAAK